MTRTGWMLVLAGAAVAALGVLLMLYGGVLGGGYVAPLAGIVVAGLGVWVFAKGIGRWNTRTAGGGTGGDGTSEGRKAGPPRPPARTPMNWNRVYLVVLPVGGLIAWLGFGVSPVAVAFVLVLAAIGIWAKTGGGPGAGEGGGGGGDGG